MAGIGDVMPATIDLFLSKLLNVIHMDLIGIGDFNDEFFAFTKTEPYSDQLE